MDNPEIEEVDMKTCSSSTSLSSSSSDDDNIRVTINKVTNLQVFEDSGIQEQESTIFFGNDLENLDGDNSCKFIRKEADGAEDKSAIRFSPPIYIQRYLTVRETLEKFLNDPTYGHGPTMTTVPKTILEVGCAELNMHKYWKNIHGSIQKLIYVDKDELCLEEYKNKLHPFACEYLCKRETPLEIELYAGCITKCDPKVFHSQPPIFAVVGIELIEHLDPPIVLQFEKTIFGLLSPPIVIITTPNSEFNQVFGLEPGKFRHWDHRFEWSRSEFECWAQKICNEYSGYKYEITGIGTGPEGTEMFGTVSQMAVFHKSEFEIEAFLSDKSVKYPGILEPDCYKLISEEKYPFFVDHSSREEQIQRGLTSYLNCYILCHSFLLEFREEGLSSFAHPLSRFLNISGMPKSVTIDELSVGIQSLGHKVQKNMETGELDVIFEVPEEEEEENSFSDYDENEILEEAEVNQDVNAYPIPEFDEDWD